MSHKAVFGRRKANMSALDVFDEEVRKATTPARICDDVFYDVIVPLLAKEFCRGCHVWIGRKRVFACYMRDHALCFRCRHERRWPAREPFRVF